MRGCEGWGGVGTGWGSVEWVGWGEGGVRGGIGEVLVRGKWEGRWWRGEMRGCVIEGGGVGRGGVVSVEKGGEAAR